MKTLVFLIMMVVSSSGWSDAYIVTEVQVNCDNSPLCKFYQEKLLTLKSDYRNETHLRQTIKLLLSQGGIKNVWLEIAKTSSGWKVNFDFTTKEIVNEVKIDLHDPLIKDALEKNLKVKPDQYFSEENLKEEVLRFRQVLSSRGFPSAIVNYDFSQKNHLVDITFSVDLGQPQIIENFMIETDSKILERFTRSKLIELLNHNYDQTVVRNKLDELERELFDYGYYLLTSTYLVKNAKNRVILQIKFDQIFVHHFQITENGKDEKYRYLYLIKDLYKRYKKTPDQELVASAIGEELRKSAYLSPKITIKAGSFLNRFNENVNSYQISIQTGERTRVRELTFQGNKNIATEKILSWYDKDAFELASQGYLDEDYLKTFSNSLKASYIRRGFVRCDIANPKLTFSEDQKYVDIHFDIYEGYQVKVKSISIEGVESSLQEKLLEAMMIKVDDRFNPIQFDKDLTKIISMIREEGYFYAEIINLKDDSLVQYSKNKTIVSIKIVVNPSKRITFNHLVILGNKKTKEKVIKRRFYLKRGDYVTPRKLKDIETQISSTGLFSSVKVSPITHRGSTQSTDVLIEVLEREYGLIEIAPGYRTDIGAKISMTASYGNLWGLNKSFSIRGQVNQRFDLQTFDERRRKENKRLLEYNLTNQFTQANIFESEYDHSAALTVTRRRFFSFDADISRISNTFSRDFNSYLSASLRHQYESINQFDATEVRDNGSFEIGALTPSVSFDFRNNRINPTSGLFSTLSVEVAKPYFLSQKNDEVEIDFYKFIARNRFYIPFKNGTVAFSLVGGVQENLARDVVRDASGAPLVVDGQKLRRGYIPSIKLFRITGMDIVRGFSDEEINRLENGKDIGDDRVQNRAFLAIAKVEPRYFINDSLMTGLFWDAGRVYVDEFNAGELRQSAGVTFKVLTPVGTLDFDYGIKLLRKREADGRLESPGRFHVSIGFF